MLNFTIVETKEVIRTSLRGDLEVRRITGILS